MGINFKSSNCDQDYILPPSLKDWLPEAELAWFIIDVVDTLDLSVFYKNYREDGKGGSLYDPQLMLALLVYAYCLGERSSRAIERLCMIDIGYRIVAANTLPDHTTIARFRKKITADTKCIYPSFSFMSKSRIAKGWCCRIR